MRHEDVLMFGTCALINAGGLFVALGGPSYL